jgi:integrase
MGRRATPRVWRDWFVTEAGGRGIHKLCPLTDGKAQAQRLLHDYLSGVNKERDAGFLTAATPYTVRQLAGEFLKLKRTTKKPKTLVFYIQSLERLIEWYGSTHVAKLGFNDAVDYIARLKKLELSNTTINHHLRAAKAVFNYGVDAERLGVNKWKKVKLLTEGKRRRIVTEEEFQKLLAACDKAIGYRGKISREDNRQLIRDILCVLRFTAMRPGELRKLRWDHIHWHEDLIIIPAAEQKTGTTAKTPQDRIIPILEEGKAILAARKKGHGHEPRVFHNIMGKEWTDQLLSSRFARLRKRAGLDEPDANGEYLVPYSLRHTRLTEAGVQEGWAYPTLQRMAGHTPGSTITSRYVHPEKEDLLRAARDGEKKRQAADTAD